MDQATRADLVDFINDHRLAVGREPLDLGTLTDAELTRLDALVMANAPYGVDPWSSGALAPDDCP